ncbi:MAG: hypothetical protein L3J12_09320, partial [Spirochaetales bacterium]|nr:hypothetical protein [Spirochaetales bacterium]
TSAVDYPETVRVTIKGRSEDIKLVLEDEIEAAVDFSGYGEEGDFTEAVQISKKGFAGTVTPLEVRVEPMELHLSLVALMVKSLSVVPSIIGNPEKGYEMIQSFVTPSSVEVYGSRTKIEDLNEIYTEDIDISTRISDFSTRVRLKKIDPSVSFSGGDIVEFSASIKEISVVRTLLGVDIITLDLDNRFKIDSVFGIYTMEIQGKLIELEKYIPSDFRFTVDCSSLKKAGSYILPLLPDVPSGVLVLNYDPKEVRVDISEIK